MENNEIMNNIEEAAEMNDAAVVDNGKGVGLIGGALIVGGVVAVTVAAYKFGKWVHNKVKAKKAAKAAEGEIIEADCEECDETVEE